ncbi:hypothetical protein AB1Y20_010213 [Prymnesium parvum]|uniref:Plastid lipid-associated protein/fibrillin conserved domain-containing protein n=1 Tax=Prymnesium parvum TaxID=97485 RepID=A0AB34K498_PRYPA
MSPWLCLAAAAAWRQPPAARAFASCGASATPRAPMPLLSSRAEEQLLSLLRGAGGRGAKLSESDRAEVHRLAAALEEEAARSPADTNDSPRLSGRWRLLFQGKPGAASATSVDSWQRYIAGDGPSPLQGLVASSEGVGRLYQILEVEGSAGRFVNVVDFSPAALLAIDAKLEGRPRPNRLAFRFTRGVILVRVLWGGALALPYPVPFALLGDKAKGWLETGYLSERLRLSRGNRGTLFALVPETEPDGTELAALLSPPPPPPPAAGAMEKDPVLLCPAQFGTEADYSELKEQLEARGHPTRVVQLKRTDWFRLLPSVFSEDYWRAELKPENALPFYYEALEAAVASMRADFGGRQVQLVAHSIGGWICRAWLGQLSAEARSRVGALVTLGTPHAPPPGGIFQQLDQTRGLLAYVEGRYPGAYHEELRYLSVGSRAVRGRLWGDGLQGLLAYASYLPLCGEAAVDGDGITPLRNALLEGAEHREVDAFHISFVPFLGTRLLGTKWYGSPEVVDEWCSFLK